MKKIAHRGNIYEKNLDRENSPSYIEEALDAGYDCEIDVWWHDGEWWLGHDHPTHEIDSAFLYRLGSGLWIHAKNYDALSELNFTTTEWVNPLNYFWHENDQYTLTSKNFIWTAQSTPFLNFRQTTASASTVHHNVLVQMLVDARYGVYQDAVAVCADNVGHFEELYGL